MTPASSPAARVRGPLPTARRTAVRSAYRWTLFVGLCATMALLGSRPTGADDGPAPAALTPIDPWLDRLHRGPPSGDPERLVAWVEEMVAAGRARAGTEMGALLLSGAASELGRRGAAPAKARALLEEALGAFSPLDVRAGLLWLDLADVRNDLGDPPLVLEALDRAEAVAQRLGPRDEAYPGPQLRARLRDDLASRGEGLRRHALAAVGRHAEAASLWERRAAAPGAGSDAAWEWAAEEAWAAGDRERALRDIDAAIATTGDGAAAVSRVSWRIRASFGQLTERGDAAFRPASISDDLFTAFRAAVRDHGDVPGGFQLALDAAAFAMAAQRPDDLLEFLSYAFTSPGFATEAARSLSRRLEIVTGARLALTAGRPEQALAWLRLAEHHQGGPLPHTEGFRLAIEDALRPPGDPRVALLEPASAGLWAGAGAARRPEPRALPPGDVDSSAESGSSADGPSADRPTANPGGPGLAYPRAGEGGGAAFLGAPPLVSGVVALCVLATAVLLARRGVFPVGARRARARTARPTRAARRSGVGGPT